MHSDMSADYIMNSWNCETGTSNCNRYPLQQINRTEILYNQHAYKQCNILSLKNSFWFNVTNVYAKSCRINRFELGKLY